MRNRSLPRLLICASFLASCSDGPGTGPETVGPLAKLAIRSGSDSQVALAGTAVPAPIIIVPQDEAGRTVVNQTATFTVIAGGGTISSATGTTNPDGTITAPTWTLGKTDIPQRLQVDIGSVRVVVNASIQTAYSLDVRFYGAPVTPDKQDLFTSAAAHVRAFIVGGLPAVNANGLDVEPCIGTSRVLQETIEGLVIFASVDSIDGRGKTLAQAGPCYIRTQGGVPDYRTVIGVMKFDSADFQSLQNSGNLQEVITHEMLHVVGLGSYWGPQQKNLITGSGAPGAAYTGQGGIAGCRAVGGTVTCANSVPVEDCVGITQPCGAGQREAHWKETTFRSELMTPYLSAGTNPLSVMSIRSFEDLNYVVNTAAADPYTIFGGQIVDGRAAAESPASDMLSNARWERGLSFAPMMLPTASGSPARAR